MQKVKQLNLEAQQSFQRADYLLNITYPYIQDPKLLLSIIDALENAMMKGVQAFEQLYKIVNPVSKDLNGSITLFKEHCVPKFGLQNEVLVTLEDLQQVQEARKDSPIEFRRKQKYVICSDKYDMKTVDEESMKKYLNITKNFLQRLEATLHV